MLKCTPTRDLDPAPGARLAAGATPVAIGASGGAGSGYRPKISQVTGVCVSGLRGGGEKVSRRHQVSRRCDWSTSRHCRCQQNVLTRLPDSRAWRVRHYGLPRQVGVRLKLHLSPPQYVSQPLGNPKEPRTASTGIRFICYSGYCLRDDGTI